MIRNVYDRNLDVAANFLKLGKGEPCHGDTRDYAEFFGGPVIMRETSQESPEMVESANVQEVTEHTESMDMFSNSDTEDTFLEEQASQMEAKEAMSRDTSFNFAITGEEAQEASQDLQDVREPGDLLLVVRMEPGTKPQWQLYSQARDIQTLSPSQRFKMSRRKPMHFVQRIRQYHMETKATDSDYSSGNVYVFGRCPDGLSLSSVLRAIAIGPRAHFYRQLQEGEDQVKAWTKTIYEYPEPYLWVKE